MPSQPDGSCSRMVVVHHRINAVLQQLHGLSGIADAVTPVVEEKFIIDIGMLQNQVGSFKNGTVPPLWHLAQFPGLFGGRNSWLSNLRRFESWTMSPSTSVLNTIPVKGCETCVAVPVHTGIFKRSSAVPGICVGSEISHPEDVAAHLPHPGTISIRNGPAYVTEDTLVSGPVGVVASCID